MGIKEFFSKKKKKKTKKNRLNKAQDVLPMVKCPVCGKKNRDNYIVQIDPLDLEGVDPQTVDQYGTLRWGGCVKCWDSQANRGWWIAVRTLREAAEGFQEKVLRLTAFMIEEYPAHALTSDDPDVVNLIMTILKERRLPSDLELPPELTEEERGSE